MGCGNQHFCIVAFEIHVNFHVRWSLLYVGHLHWSAEKISRSHLLLKELVTIILLSGQFFFFSLGDLIQCRNKRESSWLWKADFRETFEVFHCLCWVPSCHHMVNEHLIWNWLRFLLRTFNGVGVPDVQFHWCGVAKEDEALQCYLGERVTDITISLKMMDCKHFFG